MSRLPTGPVHVVAAMRSEFLDDLCDLPALTGRRIEAHVLAPLDREMLRDVIEVPAKVARLRLDNGLAAQLITDTDSGEALPLLAFILRQLADGLPAGGTLTLARYHDLGGVRRALTQHAYAALAEAVRASGLTEDEVLAGLTAVYVLILVLGPRKGEVLGLTWDDIDLDARELSIGRQLQRVSRQLLHRETKTATSDATLPLPDVCAAATQEGGGSSRSRYGGVSLAGRQADLYHEVGHADRAAQLQPFLGRPLHEGQRPEDHYARRAPHLRNAVGGLGRGVSHHTSGQH